MSAFAVRKNNIGRALVRFLIGAIIIAAIVILIKEFWLKPKTQNDALKTDVTTENGAEIAATDTIPLSELKDEDESDTLNTEAQNENEAQGDGETDEAGIFGETGDNTPVVEELPTPTPTAEPTPTPEPQPTAMPSSMYSKTVTSNTILSYKWHLDKASRINHGITELKILPSENGGSVISMVGWSFGTYTSGSKGWNGKKNTTYVDVTNESGAARLYETTEAAGATGITHTTPHGSNMDLADFTCVIDVSTYPSGTYTLGSRNVFYIGDSRYSHGYTFGDAYSFTVVDGIITEIGGIENN